MPQLILALVMLLAGFSSAWTIQNWKADSLELKHAEQLSIAQRQAADAAIERERIVTKAQNAATARLRDLRTAVDSGRVALISLSDATDSALRSAEASHAACLVTATTERTILNQCSQRYQGLAEVADRHTSDLQTLIDIAPK